MKCDEETFVRMYGIIYHDLYRFALCIMRNPHDAEDAVSEAVINAYEHIASLRSGDAFRSWMFAILANVCKKKLRILARETGWEHISDAYAQEKAEKPEYELSLDVRRALAVLTEEEQMVVALSVIGGYQSKEIGRVLHLNDSTVRSKRRRALEKMKIVLDA